MTDSLSTLAYAILNEYTPDVQTDFPYGSLHPNQQHSCHSFQAMYNFRGMLNGPVDILVSKQSEDSVSNNSSNLPLHLVTHDRLQDLVDLELT